MRRLWVSVAIVVAVSGLLRWCSSRDSFSLGNPPRTAPELSSLRRADVAWDSDGISFVGNEYSGTTSSPHLRVIGGVGSDLDQPDGLEDCTDFEIASNESLELVLLCVVRLKNDELALRTSVYKRGNGWTRPSDLVTGRRISFQEQRPAASPSFGTRERMVVVLPLKRGNPTLVRLRLAGKAWEAVEQLPVPSTAWMTTSAAGGGATLRHASWYVVGARTREQNHAAIYVIENNSTPDLIWEGLMSQTVRLLATSDGASVQRIFAVVLLGEFEDLMVWRCEPKDRAWTLESVERFRGNIQGFQVISSDSAAFRVGVEHADFAARSNEVYEITGEVGIAPKRRLLFERNRLSDARWMYDSIGVLKVLGAHFDSTGRRSITRLVTAP